MTNVVIADEQDIPIGLKSYGQITYDDIYRVSALWVTDPASDDCLLTQRKETKRNNPGKWMSAVAGTIEEGESYDENIIHETEEEIGVTDLEFNKGSKEFVDDGQHRYFVQWYTASLNRDTPITLQEEEVEDYAWVSREQLLKELKETPEKFVPSFKNAIKSPGTAISSFLLESK